jgi:GNAT superfamily N-acetyltransferase
MERDLESHRGLVLEEDEVPLGFASWHGTEDGAANLSWMGVERGRHRSGLGTALLEAVVKDVRSAGHRALEVSTVADSCDYEPYERTRCFYRARGFRDHRVDRGFYGPPEDRYDRLVLRRAL